MPVISFDGAAVLRPYKFLKESEFEETIRELADLIFGTSSVYVNVKRRMSGNDFVTIPDGYVVDMAAPEEPRFFVVENEIVAHDPFKHVGIQLLKFVTAFDDAKTEVRKFVMAEIARDKEALRRLEEGREKGRSRNVDSYLDAAVYGVFRGLVLIDEARPELHRVIQKINADISVLEVKAFVSDRGPRAYLFDTLYEEEEDEGLFELEGREASGESTSEARAARRARRARADTIVVPARQEGFERVFLGDDRWWAIRIGAAMKERLKYIAGYQVAPVSAVTHIAEVKDIKLWQDTGKYEVVFREPARALERAIPIGDPSHAPQGPVYVRHDDLIAARTLEDALR